MPRQFQSRESWASFFANGTVIADGGISSALFARGTALDRPPELWNIERPDEVAAVHREYLDAGAKWLTTNTFGANAGRLAETEWLSSLRSINSAAVRIARQAALGTDVVVAGSVGPTGLDSNVTDEKLLEVYSEQLSCLAEAGVDVIALETMSIPRELVAFGESIAARDFPFTCTFSLHGVGDALRDIESKLHELLDAIMPYKPVAIGVNCGNALEQALLALKALQQMTDLPKIARPNAGLATMDAGVARYSLASEEFGRWSHRALLAGASIIGGCCGVAPQHIAAAHTALSQFDRLNHD